MTKKQKINIAIIFGGRSAEHEVSVRSARNIYRALDKTKYSVLLIGIDRKGNWLIRTPKELNTCEEVRVDQKEKDVPYAIPYTRDEIFYVMNGKKIKRVDVVFPVLHGPFGEDGTIQGLLKMYNVPFVGPGVCGSAIGMDKVITKRLLEHAGITTARFSVLHASEKRSIAFAEMRKRFGVPFFVKPANMGSSVGVAKVRTEKELRKALTDAFAYDDKILIEEYVKGKEIECAVIGDQRLYASVLGEIVPQHDFYSYVAKYTDENGAIATVPAFLKPHVAERIQELAIKVCETVECRGMSRVDFYVTDDDQIYVGEINTIPGFTAISMFPQLLAHDGIACGKLVDRLVMYAFKRYIREQKLRTQ